MLSRAWSLHVFFFAGNLLGDGKLHARTWAPALGVESYPATGSACVALDGAMASKADFGASIDDGPGMGGLGEGT